MVNDDRLIIEGKIPMKKLEIHLTRVLSVIWLNIQKKKKLFYWRSHSSLLCIPECD